MKLLDTKEISSKMKSNITKLYEAFGMEKIFGRSDVIAGVFSAFCVGRFILMFLLAML